MKKIITLVLFFSFSTAGFAVELSEQKKALIDQLLVQTGQSSKNAAKLLTSSLVKQLIPTIRQAQPNLEPRAYSIIANEIEVSVHELMLNDATMTKVMYEAYGPRFTEQELKAIINFYNTPEGKKLVRETPAIMRASMMAGRDIARTILPALDERIKARLHLEGIKVPQKQ